MHDGLGIVSWVRSGNIVGIISGRSSPIVEKRAADLGIQFVRQGVEDKQVAATEIWAQTGISPAQTVYIGDDTPDVELIKQCGLGVAVASAPSEVKAVADLVTSRAGGRGAVREVIDQILADTLSVKQPEVHND